MTVRDTYKSKSIVTVILTSHHIHFELFLTCKESRSLKNHKIAPPTSALKKIKHHFHQ